MRTLLATGLTLLLYVPIAGAAVDPQLNNATMTTEHNDVLDLVNAGTYFGQPVPIGLLGHYTNSGALNTSSQVVSDTCVFAHSATANGENLFASHAGGTAPVPWTENEVVRSWADEAADYTYATNACGAGKVCGHYTQVAWAQTTKSVGCGATQCPSPAPAELGGANVAWLLVVCQYSPPGNFVGKRPYCSAGFADPTCALPVELINFSVD